MSTTAMRRYPGTQPFADDPLSRKLFFGRELETRRLIDQILANRLTVLYARSGTGKSSLLNASVAPALRELGYAPLITRVNDLAAGPVRSTIEGALAHAQRQGIEVIGPQAPDLGTFLAETEFWLGDRLLRPVLIIDQFEELFTLNTAEQQERLLEQLGLVLRDPSPAATVILSLREDFLTCLEDAAGHLPRVLDHRFRLAPLQMQEAREALLRPAELEDRALASRPFSIDADAADALLAYIAALATDARDISHSRIEPFFLQLICAHLENLAAARQQRGETAVTLNAADIGGENELHKMLGNFFAKAVRRSGGYRTRQRVKRLFHTELINADYRRVSLDEWEIYKRTHVGPAALDILVSERLLRTEIRGNSKYYELSHDALIAPVLGLDRGFKLFSTIGMTILIFFGLLVNIFFLICIIFLVHFPKHIDPIYIAYFLIGLMFTLNTFLLQKYLRDSFRTFRKFLGFRRAKGKKLKATARKRVRKKKRRVRKDISQASDG